MAEGTIDNRLENIWKVTKKILTNPYSLAFIVILIIGILLRLKYMGINLNGLWWDEVNWLQSAKIIAGMSPQIFEAAKAPMFPLLASFFFRLGGGEKLIRFFLVFLPSVGTVICIYFLGKAVFNKNVGIIAMSIMVFLSHHLFYEARVMADMLANFLEILAITLFICFYVKKQKPHLLFIPVVIGIIGFLTRYSVSLVLLTMIIYILLTERVRLFKNKNVWVAVGVAIAILMVFGLINLNVFGNVWPAAWHYILSPISGTAAIATTHGALNASFLYAIFDWLNFGGGLLGGGTTLIYSLVPFFVIGLFAFVLMILSIDRVVKRDEDVLEDDKWIVIKLRPIFALFLWLAVSAFFFIFIFHYSTPRWTLGVAPAVIALTAYGFFLVGKLIYKLVMKLLSEEEKYKKVAEVVAVTIVGIILILSLTSVYQRTDRMIASKAGSYDYLIPTSLWLRDNIPTNEIIMFPSYIWYEYYAERDNYVTEYDIKVAAFAHRNLTHLFLEEVPYGLIPVCEYDYEIAMRDEDIDYFVWTVGQQVWTPTPDYMVKLQEDGILQGVVSFNSGTSTQPAAWIFKVNKDALNNKINSLNYTNQGYSIMTMEIWEAWNEYKQRTGITEKDICGFVRDEENPEGRFYNDNQIKRIHKDYE